ncbi:MAG: DUF6194 family protein [Candidatus Sericytochromatia bacterium]
MVFSPAPREVPALTQWMHEQFPELHSVESDGQFFFSASPVSKMPFATLISSDIYDTASQLDRPGVFRLNVGLSKSRFVEYFGPEIPQLGPDGLIQTGHDFRMLDVLMPHPVYAPMLWACVLNPDKTWQEVVPLLYEAHARALEKLRRP